MRCYHCEHVLGKCFIDVPDLHKHFIPIIFCMQNLLSANTMGSTRSSTIHTKYIAELGGISASVERHEKKNNLELLSKARINVRSRVMSSLPPRDGRVKSHSSALLANYLKQLANLKLRDSFFSGGSQKFKINLSKYPLSRLTLTLAESVYKFPTRKWKMMRNFPSLCPPLRHTRDTLTACLWGTGSCVFH